MGGTQWQSIDSYASASILKVGNIDNVVYNRISLNTYCINGTQDLEQICSPVCTKKKLAVSKVGHLESAGLMYM